MKRFILRFTCMLLLAGCATAYGQKPMGKTMMVPYVDNSGRDVVLTWFTDTGKSVFYAWDTGTNNWEPYEINLPGSPLPDAKGTVMMHPYVDNSGRDVVLVWDTVSGKSVFYAWDTGTNNWEPYEINLPLNPAGK